jgi:hypothetical protein
MLEAKRPKIVSLVAGWLIVCSVGGALVFAFVIPTVETINAEGELAESVVAYLGRYGILAVTLIIYAFAGLTGYGLWTLRTWGRLAILAASAVLVGVSIVALAVTLLRAHSFNWNALINGAVFGWPLYYFNRPKIRALFT